MIAGALLLFATVIGGSRATAPCSELPAATVAQRLEVIRCVADFLKPPGGFAKSVAIAKCESYPRIVARLHDDNQNYGAFQMNARYWKERWERFAKPYGLPNRPLVLVVNTYVAMGLAIEQGGWSAWSCD